MTVIPLKIRIPDKWFTRTLLFTKRLILIPLVKTREELVGIISLPGRGFRKEALSPVKGITIFPIVGVHY
jgi:hypothetical protein